MERLDLIIIGSGPAGLSAAINARIRRKNFMIFGSANLSEKLIRAHQIENYLGIIDKNGKEMKEAFEAHLKKMEIAVTEKKVTQVYPMGDYFSVLADNELYESCALILATGVSVGRKIAGEEKFLGRGVSYCATCDGSFYKGKTVTVIAYSKKEEEEANFLAEIADKVYYLAMYQEEISVASSIEVLKEKPVEIKGEQIVTALLTNQQEIKTDGIFILRDSISPDTLVTGLTIEDNHVKVDRLMQTNIKGCFAAGDVVGKPYQYIKAAGEGNIAALSAASYLDHKK